MFRKSMSTGADDDDIPGRMGGNRRDERWEAEAAGTAAGAHGACHVRLIHAHEGDVRAAQSICNPGRCKALGGNVE